MVVVVRGLGPAAPLSWAFPTAPPRPQPSLLVWQPCTQTRCPSYLHWQRITLLEKSDSATSCLGFTTTWGGQQARLGALRLCHHACHAHTTMGTCGWPGETPKQAVACTYRVLVVPTDPRPHLLFLCPPQPLHARTWKV